MSTTMTLLQVRTASKQRSDMVNSDFISDSEWDSYINQSYFELYDLLIQKYGNDYYVASPVTITLNGTDFLYPLPDGTLYSAAPAFYKLLGVDLNLVGTNTPGTAVTVRAFNFADRNRYAVPNFQSFYGVTNLRYRLQGNNLWLTPTPSAGQTLKLWYIPRLTTLSSDESVVDGISGWTEYIIIDAAIKAMQKEESDVSVLMAQKQAMIQRIEAAAENRDAANPGTVNDSRGSDQGYMGSGGGWGSGGY